MKEDAETRGRRDTGTRGRGNTGTGRRDTEDHRVSASPRSASSFILHPSSLQAGQLCWQELNPRGSMPLVFWARFQRPLFI